MLPDDATAPATPMRAADAMPHDAIAVRPLMDDTLFSAIRLFAFSMLMAICRRVCLTRKSRYHYLIVITDFAAAALCHYFDYAFRAATPFISLRLSAHFA